MGAMLFSIQHTYAQANTKTINKVYKTTLTKTPFKVKDALKNYAKYKVYSEVTYSKNNNINVYRFKVQKGKYSHFLLIDENGKIKGIETGEHVK
jgi:hypothetical protein